MLQQLGVSCVKDEVDVTNRMQTQAAFSYAMTVMDKIGGQHEEEERIEGDVRYDRSRMGGRLAACI